MADARDDPRYREAQKRIADAERAYRAQHNDARAQRALQKIKEDNSKASDAYKRAYGIAEEIVGTPGKADNESKIKKKRKKLEEEVGRREAQRIIEQVVRHGGGETRSDKLKRLLKGW